MAETDPVETAWRIHAVLIDWTGKVDAKAGFALALESAVAVIAFSGSDHSPTDLDGVLPMVLFWLGAAVLGLSAIASMSVISPRLGRRAGPPRENHFLYFGDLRHWAPERLTEKLSQTSPLDALTHQLVIMSQILWIKSRRVQQSLALAIVGWTFVVLAWLLG
ncbi:Pycsar system effector family protein [Streptomyces sp. KL118A]|uniref:Pycsar system effector family protein n=1 Tax=Streptomyces sp. KL118A TaxID=3045153 RepID=UPI00278C48D8|nr:Pycsar system effector family protein [Streptomyces sp. KL118A]